MSAITFIARQRETAPHAVLLTRGDRVVSAPADEGALLAGPHSEDTILELREPQFLTVASPAGVNVAARRGLTGAVQPGLDTAVKGDAASAGGSLASVGASSHFRIPSLPSYRDFPVITGTVAVFSRFRMWLTGISWFG